MREGILKAVANPPKILWGPFLPTLIKFALQFPIMFMAIGVIGANTIIFLATIFIGHSIVVIYGVKEPHMSAMIQAFGQTRMVTKNLYKVKGNKFEP